ncbi:MAG: ATP-binding protein [Pseudomonadota bacterium]
MINVSYDQIWSALPFPCFVVDAYDKFLTVNTSTEHLLGKSARQLAGVELKRHFGPTSIILDTIQQARVSEVSVSRYGVTLGVIDSPQFECAIHLSFLHEAKGIILVVLVSDGSSKKITQSIDNLTAGRSISGLAAMLAHEIRNPLAGISGAAQLLSMGEDAEAKQLSAMISDEARRIGDLVARVEQFGDQTPVAFEAVNIHTVLDTAVRAAQAGYGRDLTFQLAYDPSLPEVAGDGDQLMQVFQNLLKNACEAVDQARGTIKIRSLYNSGVKMNFAGKRRVNLPMQVDIIDNGPGIPPGLVDDIFDPFITTKTNGSGLGLALVSKVIAAHGGLIDCKSQPGRTVFSIRLPLWKDRN